MSKPRSKRLEEVNALCGRWRILAYSQGKYLAECQCPARTLKWVRAYNIEKGLSKSCGCLCKLFCGNRSRFPQLDETGKKVVDLFCIRGHPNFGMSAMARALGVQQWSIRNYLNRKKGQRRIVIDESKVHIWEPVRLCGFGPLTCVLTAEGKPYTIPLKPDATGEEQGLFLWLLSRFENRP